MYDEILANIRTTFDVWQLEQEIELLLTAFYSSDPNKFEATTKREVRSWVAEILGRVFSDANIKKDEYLNGLKKKLKTLKELRLTLAYEPTQNSIDNIHDWVRKNVGEGVILEVTVNPTIFAGAIITYEGNYRDLSLRRRFTQGFEQSRERIFEILNR